MGRPRILPVAVNVGHIKYLLQWTLDIHISFTIDLWAYDLPVAVNYEQMAYLLQ